MTYLVVYGVPAAVTLLFWLAWSRLEGGLDEATETERGDSAPVAGLPRSVSAAPYDRDHEEAV